jgi:hypothetical protein
MVTKFKKPKKVSRTESNGKLFVRNLKTNKVRVYKKKTKVR